MTGSTTARDLAARVRALVAGGTLPEDLYRARTAAGRGASVAEVVTVLERRTGRLLGDRDPGPPGTSGTGAGAPDALLVCGETFPTRVDQTWEQGGPLWLHHRGAALTDRPHVAVVGTRKPTLDGLEIAGQLGHDLARAGVVVVSGMARGIDQAAHRGALRAGGSTVGVLGTGFDVDYPARTGQLRQAVARAGGLVTEHPHGQGVHHPSQFTARNRILVALSLAVVVVEAGARSGALNSASWAADFGREVLVVPASPSNTAAAGSLALLHDGATPVRDAADVIALMGLDPSAADGTGQGLVRNAAGPDGTTGQQRLPAADGTARLDPPAAAILPLLGTVPASPSALAAVTDLSPRVVLVAVSQLEQEGLARRSGGGVIRQR